MTTENVSVKSIKTKAYWRTNKIKMEKNNDSKSFVIVKYC